MPTISTTTRLRTVGPCIGIWRAFLRKSRMLACVAVIGGLRVSTDTAARAQDSPWPSSPWQAADEGRADLDSPIDFSFAENHAPTSDGTFSQWAADAEQRTVDYSIATAEFAQPNRDETLPQPSFLRQDESEMSVTDELRRLHERIDQFEAGRAAQEDATRTIIRQSFAERGANINDYVVFGGTLETLTFWQDDFDDVAESDIVLDTAELDFEVTVNSWSVGSLVIEYFDGTDFLFPTNQGDETGVDRFTVRQGIITIGDTTRYPLFTTVGRAVVPFGISTGDPVADVLTIVDPLTVEVFETREDFVMIGFAGPTQPPPPPVSAGAPAAPLPPRPLLFNPLVRRATTSLCSYCGVPPVPPAAPVAVPPAVIPPFSGAIYFFNGDTVNGPLQENHIEHMGGTLGYRTKRFTQRGIPWTVDFDVDATSSVFDSNFLQFEYRSFLEQIGYVPGMAAHVKSSIGPVALVLEWNGAVAQADFIDDVGAPISIRPQAWQIALAYQFDWNPSVEVIGAQGTYFTIGYSESSDLAGVSRIFDPLAVIPVVTRVGFVPEKRLSVGVGEWVLDGLRVAIEYSHAIDYDVAEGGTGNSADAVLWQMTYEW